MNLTKRTFLATVVSMLFVASAVLAGQGKGGGPKSHPPQTKGPQGGSHGPKTSPATASAASSKGPKTTRTTASATTTTSTKGSAKKTAPTTTTTPSSTTTTNTTPTTTTTLTPVQQKLQRNTNLASKLESRLPKGTDLMAAAEGFRNLGQFVAAVNVSNNLDIPFAQLKTSMVDEKMSLGRAIQAWKPTADATREASLAESQATVLINTTSTTTSTSTTDSKSSSKTKKAGNTGGERHDF
jgi:hypothetical protein